jgi:transposase
VSKSDGWKWWRWANGDADPRMEKLKIVLESLESPRQVAATARRYGISRSLLLRWRRSFRRGPKDATEQQKGFVPGKRARGLVWSSRVGGAIESEFAAVARMRIAGAVDAATLKAAVAALADGRPR